MKTLAVSTPSTASRTAFIASLGRGPNVLFLGQGYLAIESGSDPFLHSALRKYAGALPDEPTYWLLLDAIQRNDVDAALAWLDEQSRRISVPGWLATVSSFPWSAVYSSAIDVLWPQAFRRDWRDVHPIYDDTYRPTRPRDRLDLHCTYLFGGVSRTAPDQSPPLTRLEHARRRQVATTILRRLPEVVTPLGTLVIEGYQGDADWMKPEDLWPALDQLLPGQANLFGAEEEMLANDYLADLASRGLLTIHEGSLAEVLLWGRESGRLSPSGQPGDAEGDYEIGLSNRTLVVPRNVWNRVTTSALILDDRAIYPPSRLSQDAVYRHFRKSLETVEGRPRWEDYARGFHFHRDFEEALKTRTLQQLGSQNLSDRPIVVHGPTGTGKTAAVAALAYSVRSAGQYPVLYIERKSEDPVATSLDLFCKWIEDEGGPTTLVVWDGMRAPATYEQLLRRLAGRGRKLVLVGTVYTVQDRGRRTELISVPPTLTAGELGRFAEFVGRIHTSLEEDVRRSRHLIERDPYFLSALYRVLPETRPALRTGVLAEVAYGEERLRGEVDPGPGVGMAGTSLGRALIAAGIADSAGTAERARDSTLEVERLTNSVMVPGRLNVRVPLELVLRALGRGGWDDLVSAIGTLDIIQWIENARGDIALGPRSPVEALLLVQARLGGIRTELAYLEDLIVEIVDNPGLPAGGREVDFGVDVVRAIDSASNRGAFRPYFKEVAEMLGRLRAERGIIHPRLLLQEAHLLREWAVYQNQQAVPDSEAIDKALEAAGNILEQGLEALEPGRRAAQIRGDLLTEKATAVAARAISEGKARRGDAAKVHRYFQEARAVLADATRQDPSNVRAAVDVQAWLTRDLVKQGALVGETAAEALADALDALEGVEDTTDRLDAKRVDLFDLAGNIEAAEEVMGALEARGSAAGHFVRASRLAGWPSDPSALTDLELSNAAAALEYLEPLLATVRSDARCLALYFRLWWTVRFQAPPVGRERLSPGLVANDWRLVLALLQDLGREALGYRAALYSFHEALALFHLSEIPAALGRFETLERESRDVVHGPRRVVRSYVASDARGRPLIYHGDIASVSGRGVTVYAEELRHEITVLPRDFGLMDVARGDSLGEFHIAFNFLGPIADPPNLYGRMRGRVM